MTSADSPVVLAEGVGKTYVPSPPWLRLVVRSAITKPIVALDDVHVRVDAGQICAVVGPNGAGKTTLFRVLAGLTTTDVGHVRVNGLDPMHDGRRVRASIGWMPTDRRSLFLRQTTRQNLSFHGRLHGIPAKELDRRIDETLEKVGLAGLGDTAPQAFSDGMRARLLLARALLHRPRLLLLDEPTGPIDPVAAFGLLELIVDVVQEQGLGALISSHRLEEIAALQGRVMLLDKGRVVFDGDLGSLVGRDVITVLHLAAPDVARGLHEHLVRSHPRIEDALLDESSSTVRFHRPMEVPLGGLLDGALVHPADLLHVREEQLPLRDVLASFYDLQPSRRTASDGASS